jgi:hypothetical protein
LLRRFSSIGRPGALHLARASTTTSSGTPVALMENIQRVTSHLAAKMAGVPDATRRVLTLIPTRAGRGWHVDAGGNHRRVYLFVEKARTYDAAVTTKQAFKAAHAFGQFQKMLASTAPEKPHKPASSPRFQRSRDGAHSV